jgi:multisubunit Na+/H+ antiporter MnhE subunit
MKSTNNSQFSLTAARLSIGFAITFVLLLAALHFLEPEFNWVRLLWNG